LTVGSQESIRAARWLKREGGENEKAGTIKKARLCHSLAVVAILILLAMGTGLLRLGLSSRVFSIRKTSDIMARCAADAGLTMALFRMNEKKQQVGLWDGSTLPQAIDEKTQHIVTQLQVTSPKAILSSPLEEPIKPREQSMLL